MKFAIISDIHGNLEAFQDVLKDIETTGIDDIFCLGDCIGYGPDSEEVLAEVIKREIPSILGNHELAVCNKRHLNWFNPKARASIEKTITTLSDKSINFIKNLPCSLIVEQCRCVHGYPPDSVRTYLFQKTPRALIKSFKSLKEPICFVGHTHDLELIQFDGRQTDRLSLNEGITPLDPQYRYIVNIGSVGQPRDGNNKAKYAIYDTTSHELEIRFVSYDIGATVAKIKAAGLPESHATRLW